MKFKHSILILIIASIVSIGIMPTFANEVDDLKMLITIQLKKLSERYEEKIRSLEQENSTLRSELADLKRTSSLTSTNSTYTGNTLQSTQVIPQNNTGTAIIAILPSNASTGGIVNTTSSGININTPSTGIRTIETIVPNTQYQSIIKMVEENLQTLYAIHGIRSNAIVGLYEFVEANQNNPLAVFVSIDDGQNPSNILAFRYKILLELMDGKFVEKGFFELDMTVSKYKTLSGSNPYGKSIRTNIKNPLYKGRLLDLRSIPLSGTGNISVTPVTSPVVVKKEATVSSIIQAFDTKDYPSVASLGEIFLKANGDNEEVLKRMYIAYYSMGRYNDVLRIVKSIEKLQGNNFESKIACVGRDTAKITKNKELETYYKPLCKKK